MSATLSTRLDFTLGDITRDAAGCIRQVMAAVPVLSNEGWGHIGLIAAQPHPRARAEMLKPWSIDQFIRAARWLAQVPPSQTINRRISSYGWKHVAEEWHERRHPHDDCYVANGMLLAACVAMGRRVEPKPCSPNPFLAIPDSARCRP